MKLTIIHCSFIYTGGGERIVLEQLFHLRKAGHEVECYAPIVDFDNCFPDIIREYNIKTFLPQLPKWVPLRHAIILLLSCVLSPFFALSRRNTDLFIGENQPGAWIAYIFSKILNKPYVVFLNHPNRILYPREHEDWATVKDFKFLSIFFGFFRPILEYLDRVSILRASQRFVNGYFIGKEIERIYHCNWTACPSGTNFIADYEKRNLIQGVEQRAFVFSPPPLYSERHFAYLDSQSLIKMHQRNAHGNLIGGEIDNRYLSQRLVYSSDGEVQFNVKTFVKGFDLSSSFILYTGRHQPWKRIDWLIEIFDILMKKREDKNVYLVIPGPFTSHTIELSELVRKFNISDRVIFLGEINQEELFLLYRHASVYAFPSEREDFGIVVIEAMGQGLPVVAWNVGGPTDTVIDGVTGFLVDGYDKELYSNRLNILLDQPVLRRKMGMAGIERVKKQFSWDAHIAVLDNNILENFYSRVVG